MSDAGAFGISRTETGPAIRIAGSETGLKTRDSDPGYVPGCGTMRMYGFGSFHPFG